MVAGVFELVFLLHLENYPEAFALFAKNRKQIGVQFLKTAA
jgi:hypothetical protein